MSLLAETERSVLSATKCFFTCKYLTIFHEINVRLQKAIIQLNLNLTLPKSSRSHFSSVQKHFRIFLTDIF